MNFWRKLELQEVIYITMINKPSSGLIVNIHDIAVRDDMHRYLKSFGDEQLLIVCIGTDKCIGDCLAPLVGTLLVKNKFKHPIIGTLDNPVHALNLEAAIDKILKEYAHHYVIAIDACIGDEECIGDIQIRHSPIFPGKGVGKVLPKIGDISIVGVVDSFGNSDLFSVRTIRLSFIMKMAEIIVDAMLSAFE